MKTGNSNIQFPISKQFQMTKMSTQDINEVDLDIRY